MLFSQTTTVTRRSIIFQTAGIWTRWDEFGRNPPQGLLVLKNKADCESPRPVDVSYDHSAVCPHWRPRPSAWEDIALSCVRPPADRCGTRPVPSQLATHGSHHARACPAHHKYIHQRTTHMHVGHRRTLDQTNCCLWIKHKNPLLWLNIALHVTTSNILQPQLACNMGYSIL